MLYHMSLKPVNIYEAGVNLIGESARLRNFDLPTEVSLDAIGEIDSGAVVLDIGAGSNTTLGEIVREKGGEYIAFDRNQSFLSLQRSAGARVIYGDARQLPFEHDSFDITHMRFVLAHLAQDKQSVIQQAMDITKHRGEVVFIEYDWTTAHGSDAFNDMRDLFISSMLFDAAYGSKLEADVRNTISDSDTAVLVSRNSAPKMFDYSQILTLREAANKDLAIQQVKPALIQSCNDMFDQLQQESEQETPPGFYFPDFVTVRLTKP